MSQVNIHATKNQPTSLRARKRKRQPKRIRVAGFVLPVNWIQGISTERTPGGRIVRATIDVEVTLTVRGKAARMIGRLQDVEERRARRRLRKEGYTMD